MARKPTVVERFYVEKHMDVLEPQDIAKALGWTVSQVERFTKHLRAKTPAPKQERAGAGGEEPKLSQTEPEPAPPSPVPPPPVEEATTVKASLDHFARRKGRMAGATSVSTEILDEIVKKHSSNSPFESMKDSIHRPLGDEQETR